MSAGPSPFAVLAIAFLAAVWELRHCAAVHTVISDTHLQSLDTHHEGHMPAAAHIASSNIASTNEDEVILEAPEEAASGAAGLKKYHSSAQTFSMLSNMAKSCNVQMKTGWVNDTEGKGKLFVVDLGNPSAEKTVMVSSNEHARELLTSEVTLRLVQRVCGKSSNQSTDETKSLAALFKKVRFTIVPIVNEKGRILVETGLAPCQRMTTKEEGEVDLNRNMDVDWGKGEKQPWGEKAFSTYQTRILRDLAKSVKPVAFIDLHTGARDLMTPYGYKRKVSADYEHQKQMLDLVREKHCMDCKMGPNSVVIGYPNPGEIIDHMYVKEGIKYTSLWELYGGSRHSCIEMFNPPDAEYEEHVENWSGALLTVGGFVDTKVDAKERSNPTVVDWKETSESLLDQAASESFSEPATIGALTT